MNEFDIRAYETVYWEWKRKENTMYQRSHRSAAREAEQRYRDSHKQEHADYLRLWQQENKDKCAGYMQKYNLKRKENGTAPDRKEYQREYYLRNK